ncbi:MAG TPA: tetratricopeptide repeat protein [Verrucomicrobiae bacterium]|jgi:tetratricopeptide (TPR) repeat protein
MSHPRLIALLLALATLAIFLPVGQFGFVNYDDPDYVTENVMVKHGLTGAGILWAFTSFHAANWHPLTWLSHMMDCTLFGLNPAAHHFVNVLFHAANTALLFILLTRLTGKIWPAMFVAMLFAWHPLHVESVAWVSERKDVLSTFFALLALLSYTRYVRENRRGSYWLTLAWFGCSLLAKPMFVTLPCLLWLLDFWPLGRLPAFNFPALKKVLFEKIPLFLLVIPLSVVTCLAQRNAMATLAHVPFSLRLANVSLAYWGYLEKIFWPAKLAFFYPLAAVPLGTALAAMAGLAALSFLAWHWRRPYPFALVGWCWFLGTLVPVIGLVQVGEQAMADRYSYFPAIGIFIVLVFAGWNLASRFPAARKSLLAMGILITTTCVALTEIQLQCWRSDESLFAHATAVTKDNEIAHLNLGVVYEKQGRTEAALREYRAALKINPRREHTHNNIADLLDLSGQPEAALAEYEAALALNPRSVTTYLNLGLLQVELGHFTKATAALTQAAQLAPADARPPYETGKLLLKQGRDAEALTELRHALQLDPDNFKILTYTAQVLATDETSGIRDGPAAVKLANQANDLTDGLQPLVLDVLGMAFAESRDFTNAAACAQKALELIGPARPEDAEKFQAHLMLYQQQQPWRESFRATNTVNER